jgi:cell division septation protein DedD
MSYSSDLHDEDVLAGKDHELTLSTAAIFCIFFGLVALCAVFFGFGYSLGSHKSPTVLPAETATSGNSSAANFSGFKPAAGQPAGAPAAHISTTTAPTPAAAVENETPPSEPPATAAPVVRTQPTQPAAVHPVAPQAPAPTPPASTAPQPMPAGLFVQVAAISLSHPGDATLMVNALRAKGYAAAPHPAQDNFIHVLIGPLANRPAAEAMLKRLSADGYTAYIK